MIVTIDNCYYYSLSERVSSDNNVETQTMIYETFPQLYRGCRKEKLIVNFSDIGWDKNIVLPESYDLGQCVGDCKSQITAEKGNNYHFVQSALEEMNVVKFKSPCCVPSKLSYLTIVYYDSNDNLLLKTVDAMKIEKCGCF